jgi:hypothetical protein
VRPEVVALAQQFVSGRAGVDGYPWGNFGTIQSASNCWTPIYVRQSFVGK